MTPAHVLRLVLTPEPEKVNPLVLPGQEGDEPVGVTNSLNGDSVGSDFVNAKLKRSEVPDCKSSSDWVGPGLEWYRSGVDDPACGLQLVHVDLGVDLGVTKAVLTSAILYLQLVAEEPDL
ncbi:uncharacterized protein V6R79_011575 [Siganus canaliculatus]